MSLLVTVRAAAAMQTIWIIIGGLQVGSLLVRTQHILYAIHIRRRSRHKVALFSLPAAVHAHGRLMDPPARNAMWRFGFPNPVNYNDNELFCGGYAGESMLPILDFLRVCIV